RRASHAPPAPNLRHPERSEGSYAKRSSPPSPFHPGTPHPANHLVGEGLIAHIPHVTTPPRAINPSRPPLPDTSRTPPRSWQLVGVDPVSTRSRPPVPSCPETVA